MRDFLFETFDGRLKSQDDILHWSYVTDHGEVTVDILYDNGETFQAKLNPFRYDEVQEVLEKLEEYTTKRKLRS